MAAETEIKKLNKTVEDAVNMLKVYYGNSAQLKNMTDKQREAIERWFKVTDQAEENEKKKRAFAERERDERGRFISKQEKTFSGLAKKILGSAGAVFVAMDKGMTNMFKNIFSGIFGHVKRVFDVMKGHFLSLFGEESEWFDILSSIKDSIAGFFGWFAKGFMMIFRRTPVWAGKMLKTLNKMYALQIKEMKMDLLGDGKEKKKGGLLGLLGTALLVGVAALGGWIRAKLMSLTLLWKAFKLKNLTKIFKTNVLNFFKKMGGWFKKLWNVLLEIPFLGKALRVLKFALKWLGWPVTILLGIIDFIKGWKDSMGDWRGKLLDGLTKVIMGFLELPIDLLGWAMEKVLGLFGVEATGIAGKAKEWFREYFKTILYLGPIGIISDIIKGFQTGDWKGIFKERIDKMMDIFTKIMDFMILVWNGLLQWGIEKVKGIKLVGGWIAGKLENLQIDTTEPSALDTATKIEIDKISATRQQGEDLKDSIDKSTEATKDAQQKAGEAVTTAIAAMGNQPQGGGGTVSEQQQIPDELDNWIMDVKNYGSEMD